MNTPAYNLTRRRMCRAKGICYDCGRRVQRGRARCKRHAQRNREAHRAYDQKPAARARLVTYRNRPEIVEREKERARLDGRNRRRGAGRFVYVRERIRRKGRTWSLSRAAWEQLIAQPCHYCRLSVNSEAGSGLDRLDNERGYTAANVVPCCIECNIARGDRFSPDEMRVIGATIRLVKLSRVISRYRGRPQPDVVLALRSAGAGYVEIAELLDLRGQAEIGSLVAASAAESRV